MIIKKIDYPCIKITKHKIPNTTYKMTQENEEMHIDYFFAAKFMAVIEKLSKYHEMEEPYMMNLLSGNPIITMAYVTAHPEKKWCWKGLTSNPSISIAYMDSHPEYPWDQDEYEFRKYGGEAEEVNMNAFPTVENMIINVKNYIDCRLCKYADENGIDTEIEDNIAVRDLEFSDQDYQVFHNISNHPDLTLKLIEDNCQEACWMFDLILINPLRAAKKQFREDYLAALCKE
jgi:hypothetical protein